MKIIIIIFIIGFIFILLKKPLLLHSTPSARKKLVFADYFTGFQTREISGSSSIWRYYHGEKVQWSGDLYIEPGSNRKDTSTPYYPLIGIYDTTDQDVLEYHILLAKLAGIDGFICEYGANQGHDAQVPIVMAKLGKRYSFQVGINWVPVNFITHTPNLNNRKQMVEAAKKCLTQVLHNIYNVSGVKINNQPLILLFNIVDKNYAETELKNTTFTINEINQIQQSIKQNIPLFVVQSYQENFINKVNGFYPWIIPTGTPVTKNSIYDTMSDLPQQEERLQYFYNQCHNLLRSGKIDIFLGGVWPGFDDHKGRAWGEDLARYVSREGHKTLERTWDLAKSSKANTILIVTWNDWVESTMIEPSVEFGYQDIDICQREIRHWKDIKLEKESLYIPEKLFNLRKKMKLFQNIGFPKEKLNSCNRQLYTLALYLSQFKIEKAIALLPTIENKINKLFEDRIIKKNIELKWNEEDQIHDLEFSKNKFPTESEIKFSNSLKGTLNYKYIKGRLQIKYFDEEKNGMIIKQQISQTEIREIVHFRGKGENKWQIIELDIFPINVNNADYDSFSFQFQTANNIKPIQIKEIKLKLETYYLKK